MDGTRSHLTEICCDPTSGLLFQLWLLLTAEVRGERFKEKKITRKAKETKFILLTSTDKMVFGHFGVFLCRTLGWNLTGLTSLIQARSQGGFWEKVQRAASSETRAATAQLELHDFLWGTVINHLLYAWHSVGAGDRCIKNQNRLTPPAPPFLHETRGS